MSSRLLALVCALAFVLHGAGAAAPGGIASDAIRDEAAWILSSVASDGAIALTPEQNVIVPYDANLAAWGLARAAAVTRDARYAEAAWRWLEWFSARQQPFTGFVTNHVRDGDGWRPTGEVDASDSVAATYLIAIGETFAATGDLPRLQRILPAMRRSMNALAITRDATDGLYYALPGHEWKYTMDQAEVAAGLRAAAWLAWLGGRAADAAEATTSAAELHAAIEQMWVPTTGAYDWGKHHDGSRAITAWWRWYPSSTAQAWAALFDVAPRDRAVTLMQKIERAHPDWDRPDATTFNDLGGQKVGYWPLVGVALARAGMAERALEGGHRIRATADSAGRLYPFTPAASAGLILLFAEPSVAALAG